MSGGDNPNNNGNGNIPGLPTFRFANTPSNTAKLERPPFYSGKASSLEDWVFKVYQYTVFNNYNE